MPASEVSTIYFLKTRNIIGVQMSGKKRSNKEFQEYLHELFSNDKLKVKYKNPDKWMSYHRNKMTSSKQ
jgi:hypothetical protein